MAGYWPNFFCVFMGRDGNERRWVVLSGQGSSILPAWVANLRAGFDSSCLLAKIAM